MTSYSSHCGFQSLGLRAPSGLALELCMGFRIDLHYQALEMPCTWAVLSKTWSPKPSAPGPRSEPISLFLVFGGPSGKMLATR